MSEFQADNGLAVRQTQSCTIEISPWQVGQTNDLNTGFRQIFDCELWPPRVDAEMR
jgi:hypothetical protein